MEHRAPGAPPGSDLTYGLCAVALFALGNLLTPLLLGLVGMATTMGTFAATDEALFLVFFGLFFGPVFSVWTVLLPELLPPRDRAKLIGWLMALPFAFAFLVASTFPLLDHNSTRYAFAFYAALAAALAALFYFLLPETLGLSFDSVWEGVGRRAAAPRWNRWPCWTRWAKQQHPQ